MADWSIWVWVAIAVIALIIIAAIIFGTKRKDEVDPDGPFAPEQRGSAEPMAARRGAAGDTFAEAEAPTSEPTPRGRRVDETTPAEEDVVTETSVAQGDAAIASNDDEETLTSSKLDEDEETLTGPLTVPDDADTGTSGDEFVSADAVAPEAADEVPSTGEPVEDFAAEAAPEPYDDFAGEAAPEPVEGFGAEAAPEPDEDFAAGTANEPGTEFPGETAAEPQTQRVEDDFAPDEPVVATPEGMASRDPDSHFEPPAAEGATAVEPDVVSDEGRAVETVPETAPAPATEEPAPEPGAPVEGGTPEPMTPVDVGSPDDNDPPEADFTPPRHAASEDYGDPIPEVNPDDDVPRDDLGRRLDPYGNPVE